MAENRDRTQIAVTLQLAAMGAAEYQLGLLKYDDDDLPMKTRVYSAEKLSDPNTIRYLRLENRQDRNINIVPHGLHSLTLLDDVHARNNRPNEGRGLSAGSGSRDIPK